MSLEAVGAAAGKAVVQRAVRAWLDVRSSAAERNADLTDLVKLGFGDDFFRARKIVLQLESIGYTIGERLVRLAGHEFAGLTDDDRRAALAEVGLAFERADLSDTALFAADLDAVVLARTVRAALPGVESQLGEAGTVLHNAVLDECCACLVTVVRQLPQFTGRASVEILQRLTSLGNQVSAVLDRLPERTLDAPAGTSTDGEFEQRYLHLVSETLDRLELFGIPVQNFEPTTSLSVAYISLSVSARTGRRSARALRGIDWRSPPEAAPESASVRAETALARSDRMLLRGEAGSGKSTLLRWLAITAARARFEGELAGWNGRVPFLIRLRAFADRALPAPEEFLDGVGDPIRGIMPPGWVHRCLASGRALIMVDGVDELAGPKRRQVKDWLSRTLAAYSSAYVVVTSRPTAAADWLAAEGFESAYLDQMAPDDARSLIAHWHTAMREHPGCPCPPEELPRAEASLLARLSATPELQVLAQTPLLAAMLCALNLDKRTQLPRSRMPLYAAALDMLLEHRDTQRGIPTAAGLEAAQQRRILQDLAWRLSATGCTELRKTAAARWVADKLTGMPRVTADPTVVLEELLNRSGVLGEPVLGRIDFIHRTVQEYLTAQYLTDHDDLDPLVENAHLDQWRETVIMAAGHANAPQREALLSGLLERVRTEPRRARRLKLLIAACRETLAEIPRGLTTEVEGCLDDLVPPRTPAEARTLAMLGPGMLARLPTSLDGLARSVAVATVQAAALVGGEAGLRLLHGYREDDRFPVFVELNDAWRYFDPAEYARAVLSGSLATRARDNAPNAALTIATPAQFEALRAVRGPQSLTIDFSPATLEPLREHAASLVEISVSRHGPNAASLAPLGACRRLAELWLSGDCVSEFDVLAELPELRRLQLFSAHTVAPPKAIERLGALTMLMLTNFDVPDMVGLVSRLPELDYLSLNELGLRAPLADLVSAIPRVTKLRLGSVGINDLSALAPLNLFYLDVAGNPGVVDLAPLADQHSLEILCLSGTSISDLRPLAGPTELAYLDISSCPLITDLSPLAGLPKLRHIRIRGMGPDIDVAPLAHRRPLTVTADRGREIVNARLLGRRLRRI